MHSLNHLKIFNDSDTIVGTGDAEVDNMEELLTQKRCVLSEGGQQEMI